MLLLLVAFFLYGSGHIIEGGVLPGLGRLCQSILGQIALASLLALPFIERGMVVWLAMALVYCGAFQAVYQLTGYGAWMQGNAYDSGPLGAVSRVCPLLAGTVMYDLLAQPDRKRLLGGAVALGAACDPSGLWPVPDLGVQQTVRRGAVRDLCGRRLRPGPARIA